MFEAQQQEVKGMLAEFIKITGIRTGLAVATTPADGLAGAKPAALSPATSPASPVAEATPAAGGAGARAIPEEAEGVRVERRP